MGGTDGGGRVFRRGDGPYPAGKACFAHDGGGEVRPGADAVVGEMIDFAMALADLREEGQEGFSQVAGVGRRADLIADNAQLRLFGPETQHGLDEIVAERRIEPGGADDEAAAPAVANGVFTVALAPSVGRERMAPVGLPVAGSFPSVEHIFG